MTTGSKPLVLKSVAEFRAWRRTVGENSTVGFVPTMGALHAGHEKLLDELRARTTHSVLSIFVNPTQFGPNEDFAKYPRTFENDLEAAAQHRVHAVFAPSPEEMYPRGFSTSVEESELSAPLCGPFRPGHFRGVATVVLKLFHIVQPRVALFGLKDAQQFLVLKKMCRDLSLDLEIEGIPTVREEDGLALSSRNRYLSSEERAIAPLLYATLKACAMEIEAERGSPLPALNRAARTLTDAGFTVQYLETMPTHDLIAGVNTVLATACFLGKTRLIDNVLLAR
jgi:pantoate--beta-alanine ligase